MVSALLGRERDLHPYFEIAGVKFPLPENIEGEDMYPGDIISSALEPFAPSVVAGDPTVVDEGRIAVLGWGDWQPGQGYAESDEEESLGGYAYGTLDTRYPGMAVLPPKRIPCGVLPAGFNDAKLRWLRADMMSGGITGWVRGVHDSMLIWDGATTWTWATLGASHGAILQLLTFGFYLVALTDGGVAYSAGPAFVFTDGWLTGGGFLGGASHDSKLYVIAQADKKLYWESDPTAAGPWASSSTDPLPTNGIENVLGVFEAKLESGATAVHVLTDRKIVAYDDSEDAWISVYVPTVESWEADSAAAVFWQKDRTIYHAFADPVGSGVLAITPSTISNVTPGKQGGFTGAQRRAITHLDPGLNSLYGLGAQPVAESFYNDPTPPAAPSVAGWLMAYSGAGWHTVAEGAVGAPIKAFSRIQNQLFYWRDLGGGPTVHTVYLPEFTTLPYDVDHRRYAEGSFDLYSAETDAALPNTDKTGRYFVLSILTQARAPGLSTGHHAQLWVSFDGGAFAQLGSTLNPGDTFPHVFPLPGPTAQEGVIWRRLSWRVVMTKDAGASDQVTPILKGVALGYTRSPDIYDGIQAEIDLSAERFKGPGVKTFYGKTRAQLYTALNAYRVAGGVKTHVPIAWGDGETRRDILAAEIRINGIENPGSGYGRFQITARDVTNPASG